MEVPLRECWFHVVVKRWAYFDHAIVLFVGLIKPLHELPKIIKFLERRIENRAVRYSFEVHKKMSKII